MAEESQTRTTQPATAANIKQDGIVLRVVGKVNSRVIVQSSFSPDLANIPSTLLSSLEKLGIRVVDNPDNYIIR